MQPYYEADGITIICGDALEVLPHIRATVTITDPPYNVGKGYDQHDDRMRPETYQLWLSELLKQCPGDNVIYFPGTANIFNVSKVLSMTDLQAHKLLGWHKREFAGDKWRGGPAQCWEPIVWATRTERPPFQTIFGRQGRDFLTVDATHGNPFMGPHPCPKPLAVMSWLVGLFSAPGDIICDPCCGTGTTLIAAREMGRQAIGIEISRTYCELTVQRLKSGRSALQFPTQTLLTWNIEL